MVLRAAKGSDEALQDLCATYRPAIYAFLRRQGFSPEDADDIAQNTFTRVASPQSRSQIAPEKGSFRSFLCACARNEARHWLENLYASKRGGAARTLSLDAFETEGIYNKLPSTSTPAQIYDIEWSQILVRNAIEQLRREYTRLGNQRVCEALIPLLDKGLERGDHRLIAESLGMTEGALRTSWHRFKVSFIHALRSRVAETVSDSSEIDSEVRHLLMAFFTPATVP